MPFNTGTLDEELLQQMRERMQPMQGSGSMMYALAGPHVSQDGINYQGITSLNLGGDNGAQPEHFGYMGYDPNTIAPGVEHAVYGNDGQFSHMAKGADDISPLVPLLASLGMAAFLPGGFMASGSGAASAAGVGEAGWGMDLGLEGAIGGAEAGGSGAFLGEGVTSGIEGWDALMSGAEGGASSAGGLSKAALDGTNVFGANSAPGALNIDSLVSAAPGAQSARAVTGIARELGYSPISSLANRLKSGQLFNGNGDKKGIAGLLPWLIMAGALAGGRGGGGGGGSGMAIPKLTASKVRKPYSGGARAPGSKPRDYFEDTRYFAEGGGISGLLQGPGDGTSDSIPAMIDGQEPAALGRGEFVVDARAVAELGNGSTEAGAERLEEMVARLHQSRQNAKRGQDTTPQKHLPA